jgi:hypothetical protein
LDLVCFSTGRFPLTISFYVGESKLGRSLSQEASVDAKQLTRAFNFNFDFLSILCVPFIKGDLERLFDFLCFSSWLIRFYLVSPLLSDIKYPDRISSIDMRLRSYRFGLSLIRNGLQLAKATLDLEFFFMLTLLVESVYAVYNFSFRISEIF